jgi:uncharacterized membrane protein YphA (DoxX/SURF4 family)
MSSPSWGVGRRIGFRFGILAGALVVFPFPIGLLPRTAWLAELINKPWEWAVSWFAQDVLGLADPSTATTGSGDTTWAYVQLLLIAIVATLGTVVWSIVDRRRPAYPRLAAGAHVMLRYVLGLAMLFYGFAKILKSQFPDLAPGQLDQRFGDISPMGLLWKFMGYSTAYTVFAGLAEAVGGVLLLWRRTATLGALVVAAVMINVVMLNFCYDVPVKLYSVQLLIMAHVIALPRARAVMAAVLGRAAAEQPPRVRMARRWEHARLIGKLVMLASMAWSVRDSFSGPSRNAHVHELYGTWIVDAFLADGVERPPLTTDPDRWRAISANPTRLWISPMTGERRGIGLKVDAAARTIRVDIDGKPGDKAKQTETWNYTRPSSDHLVIDGVHGGRYLHVALHLAPESLLLTRGFHWISEVPFNR